MAACSEGQEQHARSFPITGIGGPAELGRPAASTLLAVINAAMGIGARREVAL